MPWTRAGSRSGGGQQAGKCRLRPASRRARSPPRGWAGEPTGLTGSPLVGVPLSTGGCTPIFSVVSGCGHPLRVPPLAVEQEKDKGSDGSTLEPGGKPLHPQPPASRAGGMPTGPARHCRARSGGQQADAGRQRQSSCSWRWNQLAILIISLFSAPSLPTTLHSK